MKNNSCEIKYYKYNFYLLLIVSFIFLLPIFMFILIPDANRVNGYIVYLFVWSFMFLPFLIYYGFKLRYYIKLKPLYLQEVKLEKVESSWNRLACFSFIMEIDGTKRRINTLAIFNVGLFGPNLIDDYSSKRAVVGYDKKNDVAIVLKVLD